MPWGGERSLKLSQSGPILTGAPWMTSLFDPLCLRQFGNSLPSPGLRAHPGGDEHEQLAGWLACQRRTGREGKPGLGWGGQLFAYLISAQPHKQRPVTGAADTWKRVHVGTQTDKCGRSVGWRLPEQLLVKELTFYLCPLLGCLLFLSFPPPTPLQASSSLACFFPVSTSLPCHSYPLCWLLPRKYNISNPPPHLCRMYADYMPCLVVRVPL